MNPERRTQIEAALRQYRETVLEHNFFLLRILVDGVEALPAPEYRPEGVVEFLRMQEIQAHLQGMIPKSIKSPRDVLGDEVRSLLTRKGFDGTSYYPVNLAHREQYFAGIRTRIADKTNIEVAEFPPADLEYLCTLVSGITGPGLPLHCEVWQFDFITPLEEEQLDDMLASVTVPVRYPNAEGLRYNPLEFAWEDWEIAVAFKIGGGPRSWGGSYALYCRKGNNDQWKWRYGVHDEDWYSDIYDSVEEFLGFYAHFREQTEEELKKRIDRLERPPR